MKSKMLYCSLIMCAFIFGSCEDKAKSIETAEVPKSESSIVVQEDIAKVRADIETVERKWADAINNKDIDALMALYSANAVSMPDGSPSLSGKSEIQKHQEIDFAAPSTYKTLSFETLDVYPQGNIVTEVGKTIYKDEAGKTLRSGKYIAVFEKQNGQYFCIREIYNSDTK